MKLIRSSRFWVAVGFIGCLLVCRWYGIFNFITLEYVQYQRLYMELFVQQHYIQSVLLFIAIYALVVILALPLPALMTALGGFLFGVGPATFYANIAATSGATIFFLIVRHSFGKKVQEKYELQLRWVNTQIERYGTAYLIGVHCIGVIPFFVVNVLLGLTKIPLSQFVWTTSLGIIPASIVFAFAGRELATMTSLADIFSWRIVLAFGLLALFALIPIMLQHYYASYKGIRKR